MFGKSMMFWGLMLLILRETRQDAPLQMCLFTESEKFTGNVDVNSGYLFASIGSGFMEAATKASNMDFDSATASSAVALDIRGGGKIRFGVPYTVVTEIKYMSADGSAALWSATFDWSAGSVTIGLPSLASCHVATLVEDSSPAFVKSTADTVMDMSFVEKDTDNDQATDVYTMTATFVHTLSGTTHVVTDDIPIKCFLTLSSTTEIANGGYLLTVDQADSISVRYENTAAFTDFIRHAPSYFPTVDPLYVDSSPITNGVSVGYHTTDANQCLDVSSLVWTSGSSAVADPNRCPSSSSRTVPCKYPTISDTSRCTSSNSFCCLQDGACIASDSLTCDINTIVFELTEDGAGSTVGSIGDVTFTNANYQRYQKLYLGESLTLSCKTDNMFSSDDAIQVDSATQTVIPCLAYEDSSNQHTTDITRMYQRISCSGKCSSISHHSSTRVSIDPTTSDIPAGTDFKITCVDPASAFADGSTEKTGTCTTGATDVSNHICYKCSLAGADVLAAYLVGGTISPSEVAPTGSVTYTCNDNFSLDNFATTSERVTETITCAVLGDGTTTVLTPSATCVADCPITAADDSGHVYTWSNGNVVTARKSIPTGTSYTVTCADEDKTLPYNQESSVTCSASEAITIESCHKMCLTAGLITGSEAGANRVLYTKISGSDAWSTTRIPDSTTALDFRTPIKFSCADTDSFDVTWANKDNNILTCSSDFYDFDNDQWLSSIPVCLEMCLILGTFDDKTIDFVIGESRELKKYSKLRQGEKITLTCNDADTLVTGTSSSTSTVTCGNDDEIFLTSCTASCALSTLPTVNDNTHMVATDGTDLFPNVARISVTGWAVAINCDDGYTLGHSNPTPLLDYISCSGSGDFQYLGADGVTFATLTSIPSDKQCYASPSFPANMKTSAGDKTMTFTINLPDDRTTTDRAIENVEVVDGNDAVICQVPNSDLSDAVHTYTCTITTTDNNVALTGIAGVYPRATFNGEEVTGSPLQVDAYYGPPALDTTGGTATAKGTKTVVFEWTDAAKAAIQPFQSSAALGLKYEMKLAMTNTPDTIVETKEISVADMHNSYEYDGTDKMVPVQSYKVSITSITNFGFGGTGTISFTTGYGAPTLTASRTSATSNTITIDLNIASLNIDFTVKITVDSVPMADETLTFASGSTTKLLENLTPTGSHTVQVIVMSAAGVPSDAADLTFSQGPSAPTYDVSNWSFTDTVITVVWDSTVNTQYHLLAYKQVGGTWVLGAEHETELYTEAVQGSYQFTGLDPGITYKVAIRSKASLGGEMVEGDAAEEEISLYACARADKSSFTLTPTPPSYLNADENVVYTVACPEGMQFVTAEDGSTDDQTACTGPATWASHSDCEMIPEEVSSDDTGKIVGGVIGALLLIILLIILIYCCCFNRKSGGGGGSSGKKYSPRDEEKQQPVNDGGESWKNPYYRDTDGGEKGIAEQPEEEQLNDGGVELTGIVLEEPSEEKQNGVPDIPETRNGGGDNISLEQKVSFNDDDDGNIVIANDNTYDSAENNV